MIRQPAVAGSFYSADPINLSKELDLFLATDVAPEHATAIIVPHAGYIYSGAVAGAVIARTLIPKTVVLLGPNHQGTGQDIATTAATHWTTPLGDVPIAGDVLKLLYQEIPELTADERAHCFEHSLEVMLPFLQHRQPELEIVPISLSSLTYTSAIRLGHSLAKVLAQKEEILLLASSDMSHFLDAATTEKLDFMAIAAMTDFDPQALYETVVKHRISMCGMLPVVIAMQAAQDMGARACRLVRYAHSGQVNGDNSRVVGYAALSIS